MPTAQLRISALRGMLKLRRLSDCYDAVVPCSSLEAVVQDSGRSRSGLLALQVQEALQKKHEREELERKRQLEEEQMKAT